MVSPIFNLVDIIVAFEWHNCHLENSYVDCLNATGLIGLISTFICHIMNSSQTDEFNRTAEEQQFYQKKRRVMGLQFL